MCDFFWQRMDNTEPGGDLADIVRSGRAGGGGDDLTAVTTADCASWQFPTDPAGASFQKLSADDFGDGFGLRDPLLHELTGTTAFFDGGSRPEKSGSDSGGGGGGGSSSASTTTVSDHQLLAAAHHQKILIGDEMKRPCSNLFSRVLPISPAKPSPLSPRAIKPLPMVPAHGHRDVVKLEHGVQISSPRAPGIKRRKSQAKKVVCIPAPAAASSRPSGEVVPSDLWAWRKYGQKPIKGSPYPRGYYRCSSSKGCSARKQVERSRTDPNMLVITYTSEHNHPWPTQRNALAGSTRSQPSKNTATASLASASKSSPRQPAATPKKEHKETTTTTTTSSSSLPTLVKEEEVVAEMENDATMEAQMGNDHDAFDQVFYNEPINQSDAFFAELAELEPDPMSFIFSRSGFMGDHNKPDEEEEESCSKVLDPFMNMFDWGGCSSSSFGDQSTKKEESLERVLGCWWRSIGDPHLWNSGWDRNLKNRSFQQLKEGQVHLSEDVTEKEKGLTSKKKLM